MVDVIAPVLSAAGAAKAVGTVTRSAQIEASQRFSEAMSSAADSAISAAPPGPGEMTRVDALEAKALTSRSLDLPTRLPSPAPQVGDGILEGLQKLRGIFDKQQMRVNTVMSGSVNDMSTLLKVQMEVVNYTVLIDVTSKLTGKSTQAFETLMKG